MVCRCMRPQPEALNGVTQSHPVVVQQTMLDNNVEPLEVGCPRAPQVLGHVFSQVAQTSRVASSQFAIGVLNWYTGAGTNIVWLEQCHAKAYDTRRDSEQVVATVSARSCREHGTTVLVHAPRALDKLWRRTVRLHAMTDKDLQVVCFRAHEDNSACA